MSSRTLHLSIVSLVLAAGCLQAQGQLTEDTIQVGGRARQYSLFVPAGLSRERPAPVVFVLHGGGGNGRSAAEAFGFNDLAEPDGALVVYPSGYQGYWNDGRGYQKFASHRENVDDVAFLIALLDRVSKEYAVDRRRIFVTGYSNGGLMAHMLAARQADHIAAIAPVESSIARPLYGKFQPSRPVSVLIVQDKGDPVVRWEGGPGGRFDWVSLPDTMDRWKLVNGCGASVSTREEPLAGEPDDATVSHMVWPGCRGGAVMEAYVVEAGSHRPPVAFLNKQRRLRWQEVVWDFFMATGRANRGTVAE